MVRWTIFGLHILYEYWLTWYANLIFALLSFYAYCYHDETKTVHAYLYMTMMLSSVYIASSVKKVVIHSHTTPASLLAHSIKAAIDNP